MRFRKKPVVIEAFQWVPFQKELFPAWFHEAYQAGIVRFQEDGSLTIMTLEGDHRAEIGDWVIQGVKGELYPCKPDIFEMTYEPAP